MFLNRYDVIISSSLQCQHEFWKNNKGAECQICRVRRVQKNSHAIFGQKFMDRQNRVRKKLSWWRNLSPVGNFLSNFCCTPYCRCHKKKCGSQFHPWLWICNEQFHDWRTTSSMHFRLKWTCLAIFRCRNDGLFYWQDCYFVFRMNL